MIERWTWKQAKSVGDLRACAFAAEPEFRSVACTHDMCKCRFQHLKKYPPAVVLSAIGGCVVVVRSMVLMDPPRLWIPSMPCVQESQASDLGCFGDCFLGDSGS